MARPLRIQYPGAIYHVMARGNHGQGIFQDDLDRQSLLETLGEACEKTGWRMGHYSRVTQAINRAGRRPGWKLNQIKCKLARLETMNQV